LEFRISLELRISDFEFAQKAVLFERGRKEGMTLSPHGAFAQGDTHPTMGWTTRSDSARRS